MFQFKSRVRYSEVNSEQHLTLSALTDYLQDTCTFQSEELGRGMDYLKERGAAWVLSSWEIIIDEMPKIGEEISVGTFPCSFKGFYGHRNFCVTNAGGERIAVANSLWVYIDYESKKPARIPKEVASAYEAVIQEPIAFDWSDRKIKIEGTGEEGTAVPVHSFFIDTNEHMNNGKYIMLAEQYLPENFTVRRVRAEYRKAAVLGDILYPIIYKEAQCVTVALTDEKKMPYAVISFLQK